MDPYTDRIVEISILEFPAGNEFTSKVNPGIPIPAEATAVHGISDADVTDATTFAALAPMIQETVEAGIPVTFNGRRFDIPLLDAELVRAGQPGFRRDEVGRIIAPEIDIYQVWIRSEERSLQAAARRFAGRELDDAHSAAADTKILPDVLEGMAEALGFDAADAEALVAMTRPPEEVDRDGKFRKEDGVVVFGFGKHKGVPVRTQLEYLGWMLTADFPQETKAVARYLIRHYGAKATEQTSMEV